MEIDRKEYNTAVLAAFLHDIGKFFQRPKGRSFSGPHENIAADLLSYVPGGAAIKKFEPFLPFLNQIRKEWVDRKILAEAVRRHHKGGGVLNEIVHKADSYSTKERFEEGEGSKDFPGKGKYIPLNSVFSSISLEVSSPKQKFTYKATELSAFESFPLKGRKKLDDQEAAQVLVQFTEEISSLSINDGSFPRFFNTLFAIFEKYLWAFPCHTHPEIADVSIFDHLKSAAAIAACLYKYHSETGTLDQKAVKDDSIDKFRLVGGQISGIQKYLYQISNITGEGGVAKRLRARSFFISAVVEAAVQKLLTALDLPVACNLVSAGGHFAILAPATENTVRTLAKEEKEIAGWLFETFSGEISMVVDWSVRLKGDDFYRKKTDEMETLWKESERGPEETEPDAHRECNYRDRNDEMKFALEKAECRKFESAFFDESQWKTDAFILRRLYQSYGQGKSDCKSCRKFPAEYPDPNNDSEDEIVFCKRCRDDKILGGTLPKAKYLAIGQHRSNAEIQGAFQVFSQGYFVKPLEAFSPEDWHPHYIKVQRLRDHAGEADAPSSGAVNRFLANHTPYMDPVKIERELCSKCREFDNCEVRERLKGRKDAQLLTFQCIAASGCESTHNPDAPDEYIGLPLIGVLKADVDNLGMIFSRGLGNRVTISRYLTLSRMIDLFFSGWMYRILHETDAFENIYTVYSGGDDLVVVGPWEKVIIFANELSKQFRRFTCENPDITLSAGIAVVHPKHPISDAVAQAERLLECSKTAGKNRITVFDTTVLWEDFPGLISMKDDLDKAHNQFPELLSARFLHRLLLYNHMYLRACEGSIQDLIYHSKMHYDVRRNLLKPLKALESNEPSGKKKTEIRWFETKIIEDVIGPMHQTPADDKLMRQFKIPLFWCIYRNRKFSVGRKSHAEI